MQKTLELFAETEKTNINGFSRYLTMHKQQIMSEIKKETNWDYNKADTKYLTHGIHPYPAMMIPQVARRLIQQYGENANIAMDPFCGSGSVLLEFELANIKSIGTDINPLAILISKVKTNPINPTILVDKFEEIISNTRDQDEKNVKIPNFKNIDYWFKPEVSKRLVVLKNLINKIESKEVKDFFKVCFSETVRKCSNTRQGEFKLYRIPQEKLATYSPNPYKVFADVTNRNIESMKELYFIHKENKFAEVNIINQDLTKLSKVPEQYVDLIVTSPPYGDSKTTVAYGQFSRLSLQWLDMGDELARQMDSMMLGGKPTNTLETEINSNLLKESISRISKTNPKRAKEVLGFFEDFYLAAKEINRVMKDNSTMCFVVGNRTVEKINIPSAEIMAEIFENFGFKHTETIIRNIPSKRMPKENSPTNVAGEKVTTMNEEHLIILQR